MQQTRSQTPVGRLWNSIQSWLFPVLEDEIGALDLSACGTHRQARSIGSLSRYVNGALRRITSRAGQLPSP
jgi:hypothetical protein